MWTVDERVGIQNTSHFLPLNTVGLHSTGWNCEHIPLTASSHKIEKNLKVRLKSLIPFGLGQAKPKHFRYMAAAAWKNRDNLSYAWKVLSKGVCDGCALGVAGFYDWTIPGIHLCMTRLNLLRLNTMPAWVASRCRRRNS